MNMLRCPESDWASLVREAKVLLGDLDPKSVEEKPAGD